MITELFPYEYCKSVFSINYCKLYSIGYRVLMFDIDNTLIHHGESATPQIEELFTRLHKTGFQTILITDNDEERTKRFTQNIDTLYICNACKPSPMAYMHALKILQTDKSRAIVIGDQMFKDILGANNSGIVSIMVKFIKAPGEFWIGWRRYLEFFLLIVWRITKFYQRLGGIECNRNAP